MGWYEDGRVAAVDHTYGEGKTRLIGTMAGLGYGTHTEGATHLHRSPHVGNSVKGLFGQILTWADIERHVTCSDPRIVARLHAGAGGTYLWVANPTRRERLVRLELGSAWGPYARARAMWGAEAQVEERTVTMTVEGRDVGVIALEG